MAAATRSSARKGGMSKTKAFRKTDISMVEANLAEASLQKEITGVVISQAADDSLFTVDKKGETGAKGWARQVKPLRLDEIVRPKSKVSVPAQRKLAKVDEGLVKKRLQAALKKTGSGPAPAKKPTLGMFDLWAEDAAPVKAKIVRSTESKAKPVMLPAAGASYNPEKASHEELMERAAAQEVARLEKLEKARAALDVPLAAAPETLNYDPTTGMVFEDIFANAKEEQEDSPASFDEDLPAAPIVKRKSKAEKKREAELAELELTKKEAKLATIIDNQALHAKTLLKQIKEERQEQKKKLTAKVKARAAKSMVGRKLGPNRFFPQALEVQLPEEITGSLRELKPEGNLLEDRFRALQQQAKIEPRVRRALKKRKFELKTYEKHSYKNFV